MSEEDRFVVVAATLTKGPRGSLWKLTFGPEGHAEGERLHITVSPARIDDMFFTTTYTLEEVEALDEGLSP